MKRKFDDMIEYDLVFLYNGMFFWKVISIFRIDLLY